ncbi:MAG: hypothetical protein FWE70_03215 [Oscillospiraceae bacterium]|nr:hypothetical protein [Oscillospiraceae bacterium]
MIRKGIPLTLLCVAALALFGCSVTTTTDGVTTGVDSLTGTADDADSPSPSPSLGSGDGTLGSGDSIDPTDSLASDGGTTGADPTGGLESPTDPGDLTTTDGGDVGGPSDLDWKGIYLAELLALQEQIALNDTDHYDPSGKWPYELIGAQLVDLNFDGVPELFLFDMGAGASSGARILTIGDDGEVALIFNDWANMGDIWLYRHKVEREPAFGFLSANGEYSYYGGHFYLTDRHTQLGASFQDAARLISIHETHEEMDDGTDVANFYLGGVAISLDEYLIARETAFGDYDLIPTDEYSLSWDWLWDGVLNNMVHHTPGELAAFLDSWIPDYGS